MYNYSNFQSGKPWGNTAFDRVYNVFANQNQPINLVNYSINIPYEFTKALEGKYFIGLTDDLRLGEASSAWARLYNPPDSGVNLFVNTWIVSDVTETPYKVAVFFNSEVPGIVQQSYNITPSNIAIYPLPQPKVRLEYAVGVIGLPRGGIKVFERNSIPGSIVSEDEEGKFIFPPGSSFLVFLSNPETPTQFASGKIAFGWWEEPIQQ